jgi:hypothetical protein
MYIKNSLKNLSVKVKPVYKGQSREYFCEIDIVKPVYKGQSREFFCEIKSNLYIKDSQEELEKLAIM